MRFDGRSVPVTGAGKGIGRATARLPAARAAARSAMPVDLPVDCAGTTGLHGVLDVPVEASDAVMAVNCRAALVVAQDHATSVIARGARGAILDVSGIAASRGLADHASHCASEGAPDALTRVMAVGLGPRGIRVNGAHPTVTLTPMAEKAWSVPAKSGPVLARIPLGRFVQPDEVGSAIACLLSDDAAMVNGIDLAVDGGLLVA